MAFHNCADRQSVMYHASMDTTRSGSSSIRKIGWLLALPKLGIILLLAAMLSLLWLLHNNEVDEERAALIKDVLWLEQNLRFHMSGNEEHIQQLAADLHVHSEPGKLFRLRITHFLKNNPEVSQVLWLDQNRKIVDALPSALPVDSEDAAFGPSSSDKALDLARQLGKRVYSEPFVLDGNRAHILLVVPTFDHARLTGFLVTVYPLDALLNDLVPWWFTEKYKVVVLDGSDVQFAAKTNIEGKSTHSYEIPFDPPGNGLILRVTGYQNPNTSLPRLLTAAIVLLGAGVFWSLWLIRDLVKKRSIAEEALRAEHAFRAAMENSLTVGMRARDLEGRITYVNPAFCRITGFSSSELVGISPPMPYWVPEQMNETYAVHQKVLSGNAPLDGFELDFRRKNGEIFHALVYEAKLIDGKGQHTGWMASVLDVTERRRTEELAHQQQEQLQLTSRLVTMGEMASTLAHELNQPLAAIASYNSGCLNMIEQPGRQLADIKPALEKIGTQAQRAGKIIRRVHDFVRRSEPKRAPCSLREIIEDCLGFIDPDTRKKHIEIECRIPDIPDILADRHMLEQVLLNLIRNGIDAMAETAPPNRVIRIDCEPSRLEVRVSITDRGCGIAPQIKEKLFTAFFTTKSDGMGIGLSICRSIIELHRGRLWAEDNRQSPTGSGTIFIFTLPIESP